MMQWKSDTQKMCISNKQFKQNSSNNENDCNKKNSILNGQKLLYLLYL